jgi:hypothetical protein
MARRERLFGIAEKMPKKMGDGGVSRRKVVLLASRRDRKRR